MNIWEHIEMPIGFYREVPWLDEETKKYHGFVRTVKDGKIYEARYQIDLDHIPDLDENELRRVFQQMIHYLQLHLPLKPEAMTIH